MNTAYTMTSEKALIILAQVRNANGRLYKAQIRQAWMTGNYNREGLENWSAELQQIRNQLGPTWLNNARVK